MPERVSTIIDLETGLDVDVKAHTMLLDDILSFEDVREALVNCGRATPYGLDVARNLIAHAQRRGHLGKFVTCNTRGCGNGHDGPWWANFVLTIRGNLFIAIATRDANGKEIPGGIGPLITAARFLVWGKPEWAEEGYTKTHKILRQLAWALGQWMADRTPSKSGLIKVVES